MNGARPLTSRTPPQFPLLPQPPQCYSVAAGTLLRRTVMNTASLTHPQLSLEEWDLVHDLWERALATWLVGREEIAVNFPDGVLAAEYEQLVVAFLDLDASGQDACSPR